MPASISLVRNAICGCRGGNPLRAAGRPDIDLPDANHLPELINLASARSAAAPPLTEDLTVSRHKIGVAIMVGSWTNEILSIGANPRPPYPNLQVDETVPALNACGGCGRENSKAPVRGHPSVTTLGPLIAC
jgi:hypothetical protein